jgi:hypothetical protein
MSEFLDDLARTLAQPMPRRRAVRVMAVTVAGAMLSGRGVTTAAARPSASGCPDPGDLFCGNCPNVNGLNYGDICCPGPNAARYWECHCVPGPGGGNTCRKICDLVRERLLQLADGQVLQGNQRGLQGRGSLLRQRRHVLRPGLLRPRHALLSQPGLQVRGGVPVLPGQLAVLPELLLQARDLV